MREKSLRRGNIVLMICAALCLVCYDIFGGLWLKGVTSSWFVALGALNLWAARKLKWRQLRFFVLAAAGLFCGMCADVLLGIAFFAGVGVFALGHILYLAAFCSLETVGKRDALLFLPIAVVSIFFVVGTPWIRVEEPFMRKLLIGYALIIAAMLSKAISNLIREPSPYRWLLAIGSVMFWFSDLMLAVDMFGQPTRLTWILCSYSYWPAQSIIAHSLFHKWKQEGEAI